MTNNNAQQYSEGREELMELENRQSSQLIFEFYHHIIKVFQNPVKSHQANGPGGILLGKCVELCLALSDQLVWRIGLPSDSAMQGIRVIGAAPWLRRFTVLVTDHPSSKRANSASIEESAKSLNRVNRLRVETYTAFFRTAHRLIGNSLRVNPKN